MPSRDLQLKDFSSVRDTWKNFTWSKFAIDFSMTIAPLSKNLLLEKNITYEHFQMTKNEKYSCKHTCFSKQARIWFIIWQHCIRSIKIEVIKSQVSPKLPPVSELLEFQKKWCTSLGWRSLYSFNLHYFFPVLNFRYGNMWRRYMQEYLPWKKKASFLLQKLSFFFMLKGEKKGHISFRRCISAVPENLVPLTETQRWSFYCHPHWLFPTFKGRQNLTVPGCCWLLSQANILSRFPYFRWSWKSKRTKPMNSLLNLNMLTVKFGLLNTLLLEIDTGYHEQLCLNNNSTNFHL